MITADLALEWQITAVWIRGEPSEVIPSVIACLIWLFSSGRKTVSFIPLNSWYLMMTFFCFLFLIGSIAYFWRDVGYMYDFMLCTLLESSETILSSFRKFCIDTVRSSFDDTLLNLFSARIFKGVLKQCLKLFLARKFKFLLKILQNFFWREDSNQVLGGKIQTLSNRFHFDKITW